MRVFFPVDFSNCSLNALDWVCEMLTELGGGKIVLFHAIEIRRNALSYVNYGDLVIRNMLKELAQIESAYIDRYPLVDFSSKAVSGEPKWAISQYFEKDDYDLIALGTKGTNVSKDLTIGSVSKYLIDHIDGALLAVPPDVSFKGLKNIHLAVDDQMLNHYHSIELLKNMRDAFDSKLTMVNIYGLELNEELDYFSKEIQSDLPHQLVRKAKYQGVMEDLTKYGIEEGADLLCFLHKKQDSLFDWFHRSTTKQSFKHITIPLLILNYK